MERWAANTLRTLAIVLISGFVLIVSLFLLLLSMCSFSGGFEGGKHPDQGFGFLVAAIILVIGGIFAVINLARGIKSESYVVVPPSTVLAPQPPAASQLPLRLSPLSRTAIYNLVYALIAQLVLSIAIWIVNQLRFSSTSRMFTPYRYPMLVLFAPFILYHLPYLILIYALLKRPDRRVFAYSLTVPAIAIFHTLFSLGLIGVYYAQHPFALALYFAPLALDVVIIVLAYRAIQQVGIHPEPASLIIAAVVTFIFFSFIQALTPLLYRLLHS